METGKTIDAVLVWTAKDGNEAVALPLEGAGEMSKCKMAYTAAEHMWAQIKALYVKNAAFSAALDLLSLHDREGLIIATGNLNVVHPRDAVCPPEVLENPNGDN